MLDGECVAVDLLPSLEDKNSVLIIAIRLSCVACDRVAHVVEFHRFAVVSPD